MWRELPDGGRDHLPGMQFSGDVETNRADTDPLQDTATFTLAVDQFETSPGEERGTATGSFYGPNGEAVAATLWYRRDGYRIQGALGRNLGE
ncbi:MAG: hypothetical protein OXH79_00025 [Boseongicola sp.]|nr:hypothetical protein [Boseongicola sp.]